MDCSEVEEVAGAFVLGAVPPEEDREVRAHLDGCSLHRDLLAELQAAAAALPLVCDDIEPPASLRGRILAAAQASTPEARTAAPVTQTAGRAEGSTGAHSTAERVVPFRARRPVWRSPALLALAAAVALAIGLGAWNVGLQRSLNSRTSDLNRDREALAALAAGGRVAPLSGSLQGSIVIARDGSAYVISTMPDAPAGKGYEAWFIVAGKPVPAGVVSRGGQTAARLQGSAAGAQAVAFTVEPLSGSTAPTSNPLAQATIAGG